MGEDKTSKRDNFWGQFQKFLCIMLSIKSKLDYLLNTTGQHCCKYQHLFNYVQLKELDYGNLFFFLVFVSLFWSWLISVSTTFEGEFVLDFFCACLCWFQLTIKCYYHIPAVCGAKKCWFSVFYVLLLKIWIHKHLTVQCVNHNIINDDDAFR